MMATDGPEHDLKANRKKLKQLKDRFITRCADRHKVLGRLHTKINAQQELFASLEKQLCNELQALEKLVAAELLDLSTILPQDTGTLHKRVCALTAHTARWLTMQRRSA